MYHMCVRACGCVLHCLFITHGLAYDCGHFQATVIAFLSGSRQLKLICWFKLKHAAVVFSAGDGRVKRDTYVVKEKPDLGHFHVRLYLSKLLF